MHHPAPVAEPYLPRRVHPLLRPELWRLPPYQAFPVPHLHELGWPIRQGVCSFEELVEGFAAAAGLEAHRLRGSRIGALWPLRAIVLAFGEDLLLEPVARTATALEITATAAGRLANRARLGLRDRPTLREALRDPVHELLGFHLTDPPSAPRLLH